MTDKPKQTSGSSPDPHEKADVTPINEIFQKTGCDIIIPQSTEVTIGPEVDAYAQYFHRVEIRSFGDLQALSLIPQKLDERMVRKAIADDDAEVLSIAQNYLQTRTKSCCCNGEQSKDVPPQTSSYLSGSGIYWMRGLYSEGSENLNIGRIPMKFSYRSEFRTIYNGIRKTQNLHLATLLSDIYGKEVRWDSPQAAFVRGWVTKLYYVSAIPNFVISIFNDITILNNATLNLSASTNLLDANNIRIHVGGKLKVNSSYIKIRCASVKGNMP